MKKFIMLLLAIVMGIASMCFIGCGSTGEKVKVIPIELTSEDYAFVVKEGDTAQKSSLDSFLAEIKADGTLDNIINSFFDGTATFTYTNPSSSEGCLRVATSADFPPFEYKKGNKFTGIDMQIAKLYADSLGKTLYIDDIGFSSVILSMGQSTSVYDVGMAGITYSETRDASMDFSASYYSSAQVIVVKESDTTFDGCQTAEDVENILKAQALSYNIGAQAATTGYMYSAGNADFEYDGFVNLTTKSYKSGALAIKDLSNGRLNAVILDKQPALMIAQSTNSRIK